MTKKLCCTIHPHVVCSLCNRIFCYDCWRSIFNEHRVLSKNEAYIRCPIKCKKVAYCAGSDVPIILVEETFPTSLFEIQKGV